MLTLLDFMYRKLRVLVEKKGNSLLRRLSDFILGLLIDICLQFFNLEIITAQSMLVGTSFYTCAIISFG